MQRIDSVQPAYQQRVFVRRASDTVRGLLRIAAQVPFDDSYF